MWCSLEEGFTLKVKQYVDSGGFSNFVASVVMETEPMCLIVVLQRMG